VRKKNDGNRNSPVFFWLASISNFVVSFRLSNYYIPYYMNNENKQRMFTVITFNETRTILMFVQLTQSQLEKVLPKYVVCVLTNNQTHLLQINGSYKHYSFCEMKIGSSKCLVLKIDINRFTKLFPSETYRVFTKKGETITKTECIGTSHPKSEKSVSTTDQPSKSNGDNGSQKDKPSYDNQPIFWINYSVIYHPGDRFYNSERYSRLCA
jgi:hypothetical protein